MGTNWFLSSSTRHWDNEHPQCRTLLSEALLAADFIIVRLADLSPFIRALSAIAQIRLITPREQFCQAGYEGMTRQEVCNEIVDVSMVFEDTTVIIGDPTYETSDEDLIVFTQRKMQDE